MRLPSFRLPSAVALVLLLAACGRSDGEQDDLAQLDRELAAANTGEPKRDPALAQSLGDQIMVDPQLTQGSNANAVRPPNRPDGGATPPVDIAARGQTPAPAGLQRAPDPKGDCPECRDRPKSLTLGALAAARPVTAACAGRIGYSAGWANRLPAAAPLYPDARVVEAGGVDASDCSLRVVTFRSSAPLQRLADFYVTRGRQAGFAPEHRAEGGLHVVGGARGDAAYLAYLRPRGDGGTDVDLVANIG